MDDFRYAAGLEAMLRTQIIARGMRSPAVLEALRAVPRHVFVPPEFRRRAYDDGPLPIGNDQTISQPYIVALMTELLELTGSETVLEVGTGSGYQAAVLGQLARQVHTIERYPDLAHRAARLLHDLDYTNITVHTGDGTLGLPEYAPFDAIIVTAAAPRLPQPLLEQLQDGGRLVIPTGPHHSQTLERWRRAGQKFNHEDILPVAFVPLVGKEGWAP